MKSLEADYTSTFLFTGPRVNQRKPYDKHEYVFLSRIWLLTLSVPQYDLIKTLKKK
jgi:hypothetical protein